MVVSANSRRRQATEPQSRTHRPTPNRRLHDQPPPSRLRIRLLPLAAALVAALPALAQQAPADDGKLEIVTITATKRVQPLQSTPIAISVISGGVLEESNLSRQSRNQKRSEGATNHRLHA